jgi:DNA-binding PadR family transcriptional regulator
MDIGSTGYVILGMLRLGKRTGYEIKQFVDNSTRFFWAASYGQIYPELKKLEQAGLIRGEAESQGGRHRRAFDLTPDGERALDEWLRNSADVGAELRDAALLKLFFSGDLPAGDRVAIARAARERHAATVAVLEDVRSAKGDEPGGMPRQVLEFGLDFHRWCADRFARMEEDLT